MDGNERIIAIIKLTQRGTVLPIVEGHALSLTHFIHLIALWKLHLQLNKLFPFVPLIIGMTFTVITRTRSFSNGVFICYNIFQLRLLFCVLV